MLEATREAAPNMHRDLLKLKAEIERLKQEIYRLCTDSLIKPSQDGQPTDRRRGWIRSCATHGGNFHETSWLATL